MLEPVLVLIDYDQQKFLPEDETCRVKGITEVSPEECSLPCKLEKNDEWQIYSYAA